jgi:hypothetical protein
MKIRRQTKGEYNNEQLARVLSAMARDTYVLDTHRSAVLIEAAHRLVAV